MAGFNLKEGLYDNRDVTEDELWAAIACVFTSKSKNDASYKYGFLKSILDNLENVDLNLKLSFDQLFVSFTKFYWDLILKHGLQQKASASDNRKAAVNRIFIDTLGVIEASDYISFDDLAPEKQRKIVHQVKNRCKVYVVGALYEDTKKLFYSFSKKDEWIQLNPRMYTFVCKRKTDIERLNNYEWAFFLEKVNPGYSANDILSRCFIPSTKANMNTAEILFRAEEKKNNPLTFNFSPITSLESIKSETKDTAETINEEARALLDDPVALIKYLKEKRDLYC